MLFWIFEFLIICQLQVPHLLAMHSLYARGNAMFSFSFTCLSAITFMCFITSELMYNPEPTVSVAIRDAQVYGLLRCFSRTEKIDMSFATSALRMILATWCLTWMPVCGASEGTNSTDFTNMFHWNSKQLFVSVVAEYATAKNVCACIYV